MALKKAMKKDTGQKSAASTGGRRKGAGRKPLYEGKLDKKIPTRLNEEQGKGVIAHCQKNLINPNLYLREASLEVAGAPKRMRTGLEKCYNTMRSDKELPIPDADGIQMPVKYTDEQYAWIASYCEKKEIEKGTFVKDAGLIKAGLARLTTAEQHREQAERLTSATL